MLGFYSKGGVPGKFLFEKKSSQLQAASRSHSSALDEGLLPPRLPLQRNLQKPVCSLYPRGHAQSSSSCIWSGTLPTSPMSGQRLCTPATAVPFYSFYGVKGQPPLILDSRVAGATHWPAPHLAQATPSNSLERQVAVTSAPKYTA